MTEKSYYWDGTVTGDATYSPYSEDEHSDNWRKLFQIDRTIQSVLAGYESELEVTNPSGQTIRVAKGAALVDGKFYETDATVDFAGATPGGGNDNYYRVVLRKSWAAQTVRLALLSNLAGADYPAVTQTDGTTWEVSVARVLINDAGTVAIIDDRVYSKSPLARPIDRRQGGSTTDWSSEGSTDYTPSLATVQVGTRVSSTGATDGEISVTFPTAFSDKPVILTQCYDGAGLYSYTCVIKSLTASGFVGVVVLGDDTKANGVDVYWMAIGPP
jgi:hypothetical protein